MSAQGNSQSPFIPRVLLVKRSDLFLSFIPFKMLPSLTQRLFRLKISDWRVDQRILISRVHHIFNSQINRIHFQLPCRHIHIMFKHNRGFRRSPTTKSAANDRIGKSYSGMEPAVRVFISAKQLMSHRSGIIQRVPQIGACIQKQITVHPLQSTILRKHKVCIKMHGRPGIRGHHGFVSVKYQLHRSACS